MMKKTVSGLYVCMTLDVCTDGQEAVWCCVSGSRHGPRRTTISQGSFHRSVEKSLALYCIIFLSPLSFTCLAWAAVEQSILRMCPAHFALVLCCNLQGNVKLYTWNQQRFAWGARSWIGTCLTKNCLRVPPPGFSFKVYSSSLLHYHADPQGSGDFLLGFTPLAFGSLQASHKTVGLIFAGGTVYYYMVAGRPDHKWSKCTDITEHFYECVMSCFLWECLCCDS